jgi:ATP-dependent helicase/DNAse subunit B
MNNQRSLFCGLPNNFVIPADLQVITPSRTTAKTLGVNHYSLESLAENIVRQQGIALASSLLSHRLLRQTLQEVIRPRDIEGEIKRFLPVIKELLRTAVDLTKFAQSSSVRVRQLAQITAVYQKKLRAKKCIDPAELFWQAAKISNFQKPYLFYGYFYPDRDELAFIDAVAGNNSILVLPTGKEEIFRSNRAGIEFLTARGWQLKRGEEETEEKQLFSIGKQLQQCFLQPQPLPQGVTLQVYPNLEAEVRGILTQVKSLLTQGVRAKEIVLVARDEKLYGTTLLDIAWEYNLPLRALYAIPLEHTRMGAWLKLLLEVIETNFPFEATAKLLSHPLARQLPGEIWQQAKLKHPQNFSAWQELGIDLSLLQLPKRNRRDKWVQLLQDILEQFQLRQQGKRWAREIVAFYQIQDAFVQLAQPETEILTQITFLQDVRDTLALLTVPAQPGRGGIELHAPLSLLGAKYNYVFVVGMGEGIFPSAITTDSILDFFERKQLAKQEFRIETAVTIANREALAFYSLLGVAQTNITFSYSQSIQKESVLPSPYLTRLGLKPISLPDLPVASLEKARQAYLHQPTKLKDITIKQIVKAWQVEKSRETATVADEYDGVVGIPLDANNLVFSASQLSQLGQCPFKWFAYRLLKLKELPEAELDLSTIARGNLYHRCLELSLEKIKTAADLERFNLQQLEQAFLQAEKELELSQLPTWQARRQEHLELLYLNLITPEFLPAEREVLTRETKFSIEWHGLQIEGKVDRIDRTATGLTIIDYKTSSSTPLGIKDEEGKASLDLQLPLYQAAIEQSFSDEVVEATYYSLTKRKKISSAKRNPEQLSAFAEKVQFNLQHGYYPVAPDLEQKACQYCSFDLVCRRGDRLHRKTTN